MKKVWLLYSRVNGLDLLEGVYALKEDAEYDREQFKKIHKGYKDAKIFVEEMPLIVLSKEK